MKKNIISKLLLALTFLAAIPMHADGLQELNKLGDLDGVSFTYQRGPYFDNLVESNLTSDSMLELVESYIPNITSVTIIVANDGLQSDKNAHVIRHMKDAVAKYVRSEPDAEIVRRKKDSSCDNIHRFIAGKNGEKSVYLSCNDRPDLGLYAIGIFVGDDDIEAATDAEKSLLERQLLKAKKQMKALQNSNWGGTCEDDE